MAELTEDDLFSMSDEELEAAMKEAKADEVNEEIDEPTGDTEEVIDTENKVEDELEQPTSEDSEDNADTEEEATEDDVDEPGSEEKEPEGKEPEGEPEKELDDNSDAEKEVEEEPVQPEQKYKFKANGLEYEFSKEEMEKQFPKVFGQAMDYTKKMQKIKPWRKTIDAIDQAGISNDDLNLAIDVLKGDKGAIGELLKRTGVDALDLDTEENNYEPKDYGRDETTLALEEVVNEISSDPEYTRTQKVLGNDWDDTSWNKMTQDPGMIKALHVDMKTGVFDKVQPIANKLKIYDGGHKSDLDYYLEAGDVFYAQQNAEKAAEAARVQAEADTAARVAKEAEIERVKTEEANRVVEKQKVVKRKSAAPTKSGSAAKSGITDYLDDSDEEFDKWYASLQEKY